MKVKCIDDDGWKDRLTIGKTYEVIEVQSDGDYVIIDDIGDENWFHDKRNFKTISEYRNETINKLLEDEC